MSPNARTLKWLRDNGQTPHVVETTIPKIFIKQDMWCADICSFNPLHTGVNLWQATTGDHAATRIKKCCASKDVADWIADPHRRFFVIGWRKLKGEGNKWHPKIWRLMPKDGKVTARLVPLFGITIKGNDNSNETNE